MNPAWIYKLVEAGHWRAHTGDGTYAGAAIDHRDGYIHLSSADHLHETARLHFRGRADLLLVAVDPEAVAATLKWEASRGGILFPHLYGPLPLAAVREMHPCWVDAAGMLHLVDARSPEAAS